MYATLAALAAGLGITQTASAKDPAAVPDFISDVQPILVASCIECHGTAKQKGGLRLDVRAAAMRGGSSGPAIMPGDAADSYLLHRVRGAGDEPRMPEKKPALSAEQIATLTRWIEAGAVWPDTAAGDGVAGVTHWSFQRTVRPTPPAVHHKAWVRTPIDAFILARLEAKGLTPSPQAAKQTLLRRVHLDLTGLPPTPQQIASFIADPSPDAYENAVARLLASPAYGERWAKHWLDQARYADSNGYSIDAPREIWKYRDWVINAINSDLPFDKFSIEQLAGDMLPDATIDQKIATGFHRNTMINQEGGIDKEQFRVEAVIDRVGTTGTVWMGLTVACAQCHNHKFDPISQKEYYRLFAFLNNQDEPTLKLLNDDDEKKAAAYRAQIAEVEAELKLLKETPEQKKDKSSAGGKLRAKAADLKKKSAAVGTSTMVLEEMKTPRDSFLFIKGDFTRRGEDVTPGTPGVLPPIELNEKPATLNRLDLAKWLVDPNNPLTARVTVNRIWMRYFGKGIVETENDFGTQGTQPTHPDLLDWLATEFIRVGWSQKALHRLIVTSAVYRQSSLVRPEHADADPYNKLLGRQNRLRLDAEIVRDVALTASGLLSKKIGGPSVFPPQPAGVMGLGQVKREWKTSAGEDRYRRGMYTFLYRGTPHPLLSGFDAPDGTSTCTRRLRSNTPLQALTVLNDEAFVEFSRALARRCFETPMSDEQKIEKAFGLCTGRTPDADELKILRELLSRQRKAFEADAKGAELLCAANAPIDVEQPEFAAWVIVARTVLNLDETVTRE